MGVIESVYGYIDSVDILQKQVTGIFEIQWQEY
jgi:hypothetical protein